MFCSCKYYDLKNLRVKKLLIEVHYTYKLSFFVDTESKINTGCFLMEGNYLCITEMKNFEK